MNQAPPLYNYNDGLAEKVPPPQYNVDNNNQQPPPPFNSNSKAEYIAEKEPYSDYSAQSITSTANTSSSRNDSQPPSHTQEFHIHQEKWLGTNLFISLPDNQTHLYYAVIHTQKLIPKKDKPDIQVYRGSSSSDPLVSSISIGSSQPTIITFDQSSKSTTVERDTHESLKMKMKIRYSTRNPVNGRMYTWKSTHQGAKALSTGNLKLVDCENEEMVIAKFLTACWSRKDRGKLEVFVDMEEEMMDWVVSTLMTMMEKERRRELAGLAGSSNSGGSVAAIVAAGAGS